jgi:hypothetical protein
MASVAGIPLVALTRTPTFSPISGGLMATKRQTTMAKLQREQRLREKREAKQEKKDAAAAAKIERVAEGDTSWLAEPAERITD